MGIWFEEEVDFKIHNMKYKPTYIFALPNLFMFLWSSRRCLFGITVSFGLAGRDRRLR